VQLDLALVAYDHTTGAEMAYAGARDKVGDAPWLHEVAFVERHKRGRIVMRGTFAGHYIDIEDEADPIGRDTAVGALTGAIVGLVFGPPGFAAGLVGGGAVGGLVQGSHVEELHGAFFDEVRADLPEDFSALVLLAAPDHVDAMVEALEDTGGKVIRRTLSDDAVQQLAASVATEPAAAPVIPQPKPPDAV
jgi:uncharacterized membrane protein